MYAINGRDYSCICRAGFTGGNDSMELIYVCVHKCRESVDHCGDGEHTRVDPGELNGEEVI